MSKHPGFKTAEPVTAHADQIYAIVLRFAGLKPRNLYRFRMHDLRSGGDLTHVRLLKSTFNRIEHGDPKWDITLKRRINLRSKGNMKREVSALRAMGRKKAAEKRLGQGLQSPWHGLIEDPLREGILTVNKEWFGGKGVENWEEDRVETFRHHAMSFLHAAFPNGQLLYAASHSDEEAFHIHFAVGTWQQTTTQNRGSQIQLRPKANPLIADYEFAQDLAGAHFEQIGLCRGARHAETRRKAKVANEDVPEKRYHVSPSQYRAAERHKGQLEAETLVRSANETCTRAIKKISQRADAAERKRRAKQRKADQRIEAQVQRTSRQAKEAKALYAEAVTMKDTAEQQAVLVINAAKDTGTKVVRKSRKKAIAEARLRKAASEAEILKVAELRVIEGHRLKAVLHQISEEQSRIEEAANLRLEQEAMAAEAMIHASRAGVQAQQAHDLRLAEMARAREAVEITAAALSEKTEIEAEIADLNFDLMDAAAAKRAAEQAKVAAEADEAESKRRKAELEGDILEITKQRSFIQHREKTLTDQLDAVEASLHFIASGVVEIDLGSEGLSWGNAAPQDSHEQGSISATIEAAGGVLRRLIHTIANTVAAVLSIERQRLAKDAQILFHIREEIGIGRDEKLQDVLNRNRSDEPSL